MDTNFQISIVIVCHFTSDRVEISKSYFEHIKRRLLGENREDRTRMVFREAMQKEKVIKSLDLEVMLEGISLTETELYETIYKRYGFNLKKRF